MGSQGQQLPRKQIGRGLGDRFWVWEPRWTFLWSWGFKGRVGAQVESRVFKGRWSWPRKGLGPMEGGIDCICLNLVSRSEHRRAPRWRWFSCSCKSRKGWGCFLVNPFPHSRPSFLWFSVLWAGWKDRTGWTCVFLKIIASFLLVRSSWFPASLQSQQPLPPFRMCKLN